MSAPALPPIPVLVELGVDLAAARYYALACAAMLYYDVFLTFSIEVERVWSQPWSLAKGLWMFHRYYNLCIYATTMFGFLYTGWTPEMCSHYFLYPFLCTVPSHMCIATVLILRTWSLYRQNNIVLWGLIFTYMINLGLQFWPLQFAINVPLPPPFKDCILATRAESGLSAISIWVGTAFFDCTVFALTLGRTLHLYKQGVRVRLVQLMLRDGILYFGVIVSANIMMILTFILAQGSLKVINATFMHTITVVIVSHLMLNLKSEAAENKVIVGSHDKYPSKVPAWSVESGEAKSMQNHAQSRPSAVSATAGSYRPPSGIGNGYPKPPPMYSNKNDGSSWRNDTMEMQGLYDVAKSVESGVDAQPHQQYAYGSSNQWHRRP